MSVWEGGGGDPKASCERHLPSAGPEKTPLDVAHPRARVCLLRIRAASWRVGRGAAPASEAASRRPLRFLGLPMARLGTQLRAVRRAQSPRGERRSPSVPSVCRLTCSRPDRPPSRRPEGRQPLFSCARQLRAVPGRARRGRARRGNVPRGGGERSAAGR